MASASRMLVVISLTALVAGCADGLADRPVGRGSLLFTASRAGDPVIYSMNADGSGLAPIGTELTSHVEPAWSPDGTQIAFAGALEGGGDHLDIYVMEADGTDMRQLTSEPLVDDRDPAWSPDGTQIAFSRLLDDGHRRLFVVDVGTGEVRQLTDDQTFMDEDPDWSPDGRQIVFTRNADTFPSIYVIDAAGATLRRLTETEHADTAPVWSPDGQRIAFVRDEQQEGDYNVYVMDADGANPTRLAIGSGILEAALPEPAWSPNGAEIGFFRGTDLIAIRSDGSDETGLLTVGGSMSRPYLGMGGVDWVAP